MLRKKMLVMMCISGFTGFSGLALTPALAEERLVETAAPTARTAARTPASANAGADSIEEVIVTARRREENLQAVPISVTAISGDQLVAQGIRNAFDLANHVPSLVTNSQGMMNKGFSIGIRGVRIASFLLFDDPTVSTYFAEGVIAHPWGFGDSFYDLQSVQVLKGPQGTLFGRNTTGGALLVEPNKASIDEGFGGNVKVTLGDYNLQQFDGVVNIPLNDVAALRIAGEHKKRDGYTTNVLTGQKLDGVGNDALRISLLLRPTKDVSSHTILDYLNENNAPNSAQVVGVFAPNGGFGLGGPLAASYANWSRLFAEQKALGPWKVAEVAGTNGPLDQMSPVHCNPGNPQFIPNHFCRSSMTPKETLRNWGLLNNTQVDYDDFTIKNIVAYRTMKHNITDSISFNGGSPTVSLPPSGGGDADQSNDISQWQEEFQILGKALSNRLVWQTGAFIMREWGTDNAPNYTNSTVWSNSTGFGDNRSKGLFAQGTYALSDKLKATLGVRKNWDERIGKDFSTATNGTTCQIRVGNTAAFLPLGACVLAGDKTWQANTWTTALDYQITDGTLIYGTHRRGYKSGGYALRTHRAAQFSYDPEFVTDSEVGIKSDWSLFDRPIRTNFALYNLDYTSQQIQVTNNGTNPVTSYVANAGKSRVRGAEFEATYKPTRRLEISGFISYTNPKYVEYSTSVAGGGSVSLNNRPFGIALYIANLSAAYELPLSADLGSLTVRADASFKSKAIVDESNAGLLGVPGANPATAGFTMTPQPGYGQLNLRADWDRPFGNPVTLGLFVTNVTNVAFLQSVSAVNGLAGGNMSPPRMFGVELSYRFGDGFRPKD